MTDSPRAYPVGSNSSTARPIKVFPTGVMQPSVGVIGVSAEARPLRRMVGTTAWAVLEDLLLDAQLNATDGLVAATNVRRLAADLGVSKDTSRRALIRLIDAGVVSRVASRRDERGTFPTAAYLVDVAQLAGITLEGATSGPSSRNDRQRPVTPARRTVTHAQSSLFDDLTGNAR